MSLASLFPTPHLSQAAQNIGHTHTHKQFKKIYTMFTQNTIKYNNALQQHNQRNALQMSYLLSTVEHYNGINQFSALSHPDYYMPAPS